MKQQNRSKAAEPADVLLDAEYVEELVARGTLKLSREQAKQLAAGGQIKLPAELVAPLMKPAESRPTIEWIDPVDAVHLLAPHVGGDANAKSIIGERLRDGAVQCTSLWLAEEPDVGQLPSRRPASPLKAGQSRGIRWSTPVNTDANVHIIGGAFWSYSEDWERDFKRWQWSSGTFVASAKQQVTAHDEVGNVIAKGRTALRMVAKGVRFNRADIEAIASGITSPAGAANGLGKLAPPKKSPSNSGRKRNPDWDNWIAEVVIFIRTEDFDLAMKDNDFHAAIAARLSASTSGLPRPSRSGRASSRTSPAAA